MHNLDNMATLRRLIAFYARVHNEIIPHAAFNGQTPDEMYFRNGAPVPIEHETPARSRLV
jgi:putative transposase